MVFNHQLYKKDIFFPDWSPSPFLVLIVEFFLKNQVTFHYSAHNVTNPRKPLWHKGFGDSSSTEHFTKRLKTAYILLFKRSKIRSKSSRK